MPNNQFFPQGDESNVAFFAAVMPASTFVDTVVGTIATLVQQGRVQMPQPAPVQQLVQGNQPVAPQVQQLPPVQAQPNMYAVQAIAPDRSVRNLAVVAEGSPEYTMWVEDFHYRPMQSTAGTLVLLSPDFWQPFPAAQQTGNGHAQQQGTAPQPQPNHGAAQHGNGSGNQSQNRGNGHGNAGSRTPRQQQTGNGHAQQNTTPPPAAQPQSWRQQLGNIVAGGRRQGTHS